MAAQRGTISCLLRRGRKARDLSAVTYIMPPMETTPPSHSKGRELTQSGTETILNLVPVVGGTIATTLTAALNYRPSDRREKWFSELAAAVNELQERFEAFDPETLAENEQFLDAVVTATRTVDRSSQREKIAA